MGLDNLTPPAGSRRPRKRVGRGESSGWGKTAGRGHKGQNSRSGGGVRPGFEGGQMPLHRRLPKRGFKNRFRLPWSVVNLDQVSSFEAGASVDIATLKDRGLVRRNQVRVALLGRGEVSCPLHVKVQRISASARAKVEAAGGTVEILPAWSVGQAEAEVPAPSENPA